MQYLWADVSLSACQQYGMSACQQYCQDKGELERARLFCSYYSGKLSIVQHGRLDLVRWMIQQVSPF